MQFPPQQRHKQSGTRRLLYPNHAQCKGFIDILVPDLGRSRPHSLGKERKQVSGPDLIFKFCTIKRLVKPTYELADHTRLGVRQQNERLPHLNLGRGKRDWKCPHRAAILRELGRRKSSRRSLPAEKLGVCGLEAEPGSRCPPLLHEGGSWGRDRGPRGQKPRGGGGAEAEPEPEAEPRT